MRVDRRGRRKDLIVGAAHEHFASDAAADGAARDRDDIAIAALALADSLRRAERDVLRDQYLALLLAGLLDAVRPRLCRDIGRLHYREVVGGAGSDFRHVV